MKPVFRLLGGCLLALTLVACHAPAVSTAKVSTSEIKVYQVPAPQSQQIAANLAMLLGRHSDRYGANVTSPFPGTLMVFATPQVQASVGRAISALEKMPVVGAAPEALQVHFWLVAALSGSGEDSAVLKPLDATLSQVRARLGPSHFMVQAAGSAAATFNNVGKIVNNGGSMFTFNATPGSGGVVNLKVGYSNTAANTSIHSLDSTVAVHPGTYVVLAEAPPAANTVKASDATLMNLLVVRVDRAATATSH